MNPLDLDFSGMTNVVPIPKEPDHNPAHFTGSIGSLLMELYDDDASIEQERQELAQLFDFQESLNDVIDNSDLTPEESFNQLSEIVQNTLGSPLAVPELESFETPELGFESAIGDFFKKIKNWISTKVSKLLKSYAKASAKRQRLSMKYQDHLNALLKEIPKGELKTGELECSDGVAVFLSDGNKELKPSQSLSALLALSKKFEPTALFKAFNQLHFDQSLSLEKAMAGINKMTQDYIAYFGCNKQEKEDMGDDYSELWQVGSGSGNPAGAYPEILVMDSDADGIYVGEKDKVDLKVRVMSRFELPYAKKPGVTFNDSTFKAPKAITALSGSDLTALANGLLNLQKTFKPVLASDASDQYKVIDKLLVRVNDWENVTKVSEKGFYLIYNGLFHIIETITGMNYDYGKYLDAQTAHGISLIESHL